MASFSPTKAFSKVDLPTFGLPAIDTKPARCGPGVTCRHRLWRELRHAKCELLPPVVRSRRVPRSGYRPAQQLRRLGAHALATLSEGRRRLSIRCRIRDESSGDPADGRDPDFPVR